MSIVEIVGRVTSFLACSTLIKLVKVTFTLGRTFATIAIIRTKYYKNYKNNYKNYKK